jgi:hypothetical protein
VEGVLGEPGGSPNASPPIPACSFCTAHEEPDNPEDEHDQSDPQQQLCGSQADAAEDEDQQQKYEYKCHELSFLGEQER